MADDRRNPFASNIKSTNKNPSTKSSLRQKIADEIKNASNSTDIITKLIKTSPEASEEIILAVLERGEELKKKRTQTASEAAMAAYRKYINGQVPLHKILEKFVNYKHQYGWGDAEYDEFRKRLEMLLTGNVAGQIMYNQNISKHKSKINKMLGKPEVVVDNGLQVADADKPILKRILDHYIETKELHNAVFMNSLLYTDCSLVALTGEYNRSKDIANNYIHPIFACMFVPKIEIFDITMIYSNFGRLIDTRRNKMPVLTEPDSMLLNNIISDPNDVVCDSKNPLEDIEKRYNVQTALWDTVLKLRNGNYYNSKAIAGMLTSLHQCKNNVYDNADLAYSNDEGAIMRRLFSVFGFRPTIIGTKPISAMAGFERAELGMVANNNDFTSVANNFAFDDQFAYTVTYVPMVAITVPPNNVANKDQTPIELRVAQNIWINEGNNVVAKEQTIIFSNEVLIFYVRRRGANINFRTYLNPVCFSQLPLTMSGFEKLNTYPVNVPDAISLGTIQERYFLRSVVTVTEIEYGFGADKTSIVTGATGLIMSHRNVAAGVLQPKYYLYDPFGASLPVEKPDNGGIMLNKPFTTIPPFYSSTEGTDNSFFGRASKYGTVFIYAKPEGFTNPATIVG